ncbi:hypothetical protein K4K57_003025 [Colletotrichum sp. SAR 10_99]|nr:hypothetical protein K4K57_003025 [Colletotrichum sp. SAR 10_99]
MQVVQLPPGPETGNFYIPICNLPFDTRWQALKEWLSRDCEVDYIQLYHPTSGWIRVKGPYNFYRACDHLKNGVFNGRCIIYDDSNMTSAVVVKQVHNDNNAIPVNGTIRARKPAPAPFSAQIDHQSGPRFQRISDTSAWGLMAFRLRELGAMKTLRYSTPEDQIKALIRQSLARVTPVKAELQRIDIPRGSGIQNRGHAIATFRTADIARSVAESLNGKIWNSRRLEARLATEGVAEEQASHASPTPAASLIACPKPLGISQSFSSLRVVGFRQLIVSEAIIIAPDEEPENSRTGNRTRNQSQVSV